MLSFDTFYEVLDFLSQVKEWTLDDLAQRGLYNQVRKLEIGDDELPKIANSLLDDSFAKPADLVKICREYRRMQRCAAPPPALPAPSPMVCDEQIKFHRLGRFLASDERRLCKGCRPSHCACWAAVFAEPVTPEEHQAFMDGPVRHPLSVLGRVPAPDPKEEDLVWR